VKAVFGVVLILGCLVATVPALRAQASNNKTPDVSQSSSSKQNESSGQNNDSGQSTPAANSQSGAARSPSRVQTQTNGNPFPEDTSSVPVMPSNSSPGTIPGLADESTHLPVPADDLDPVRTPEEQGAADESNEKSSSSSLSGLSDLLPSADDDTTTPGKKHGKNSVVEPEHQESAQEDENVGNYYLDNKDWKGALSRFESALVLDPYNPDVYWGLAECERHLGNFAEARANYVKVTEYDPGSRHAREARKALQEPVIANAKTQTPARPSTPQQ